MSDAHYRALNRRRAQLRGARTPFMPVDATRRTAVACAGENRNSPGVMGRSGTNLAAPDGPHGETLAYVKPLDAGASGIDFERVAECKMQENACPSTAIDQSIVRNRHPIRTPRSSEDSGASSNPAALIDCRDQSAERPPAAANAGILSPAAFCSNPSPEPRVSPPACAGGGAAGESLPTPAICAQESGHGKTPGASRKTPQVINNDLVAGVELSPGGQAEAPGQHPGATVPDSAAALAALEAALAERERAGKESK